MPLLEFPPWCRGLKIQLQWFGWLQRCGLYAQPRSQLRLGFSPWLGNFHMPWVHPLKKKKMPVFSPNLTHRFKALPIRIPASYLLGIDKVIVTFKWRRKRPMIANRILKENNVGGQMLFEFKI